MRLWFVMAIMAVSGAVWADDASPQVEVEFNSTQQIEQSCRLTFVAQNQLETHLDRFVLEAVLFDRDGSVDRLTLFDLQDLPVARARVRQFDVPDLQCDDLGKILINNISACDAEGVAVDRCLEALHVSSRTDVEVEG